MPEPRTLIVLIAYKSNLEWLSVALLSLHIQTRKNFRCVVVDSTPKGFPEAEQTPEALDMLRRSGAQPHQEKLESGVQNVIRQDPRFVYRHYEWVPHGDVQNKVNQAVVELGADCEYVVIMSDDDFVAPRFLEVQAGSLDRDPKAGFAQGGVHLFGDTCTFWLHDLPLDKQLKDQVGQNQFAGTCVMRMAPFREYGGYDLDAVPEGFPVGLEDFNMFMHFLRNGWRYTSAGEILLFARQNPTQNNRRLYGTPIYSPLLLKICRKQGIDCRFRADGSFELSYEQGVRT